MQIRNGSRFHLFTLPLRWMCHLYSFNSPPNKVHTVWRASSLRHCHSINIKKLKDISELNDTMKSKFVVWHWNACLTHVYVRLFALSIFAQNSYNFMLIHAKYWDNKRKWFCRSDKWIYASFNTEIIQNCNRFICFVNMLIRWQQKWSKIGRWTEKMQCFIVITA